MHYYLKNKSNTCIEQEVKETEDYSDNNRRNENHFYRRKNIISAWPDDLLKFCATFFKKLDDFHISVPTILKITGQAGFEPATNGFGDRHSTIGATDLKYINLSVINNYKQKDNIQKLFCFCFFVQCMLAIKRTILIQLKLTLNILAVFISCIVLAFAF